MATTKYTLCNQTKDANDEKPQDPATSVESADITLKRMLGIPAASAMVTGAIIGSGIFVSARWTLLYSGSVAMAMLIWLLGGVVSFLGGLCWVELGLTFPKCGGEYMLIFQTLGDLPAFMCLWLKLVLIDPISAALGALVFSSYVIAPFFPGCGDRGDLVPLNKTMAAVYLGTITFINIFNIKWAARVQIVFTVAKILALVMIIVTGLVRIGQGHTSSFENPFQGTTKDVAVIGLAFQSVLWAYDGWDTLNDITEELKSPARSMPWAVFGSLGVVTGCYLLVNVAYLAVLSPQDMKDSPATAALFAGRMYGGLEWLVSACVASSVFGAGNAYAFAKGRVAFVAAREGQLPNFLAMIHATQRTPVPALLVTRGLAFLMLIPETSSIDRLISLTSFLVWLMNLVTTTGMLWARYRHPGLTRPLKLPLFLPIIFLLICLYLTISPMAKAPLEALYFLMLLLTGLPVYFIFLHYKLTPKWIHNALDKIAYHVQAICNVTYPKMDITL